MNPIELKELYTLIGNAIWQVQYLEDVLVTLLSAKIIYERRCAGNAMPPDDAERLLADKRKITLGPLLEACRSRKIIRTGQQSRFDAFKDERHWLVHRSVIESGDNLYAAVTREAVFVRIAGIGEEAISLKAAVFEDFQAWMRQHGVKLEAASA